MITNRGKVKAIQSALLAALLVLVTSAASHAGPLGLTDVDPYPDIQAGFLTTTYNATSGVFQSNGWALSLTTVDGVKTNITTNFSLQANLLTGGGSLTIGSGTSTLLKSVNFNLSNFAYEPAKGGALEFLFTSPTGIYTAPNAATGAPAIYSPNLPLDVILLPGAGFLGNLTASWSSSGGTADVRTVEHSIPNPEPSALLLTLVAAAGLFLYRLRTATALAQC